MKQEIYTSSTKGEIPLSFTGRHLLQSLREAIIEAIDKEDYNINADQLSRIRGDIAQYMSTLERKNILLGQIAKENSALREYLKKLSDEKIAWSSNEELKESTNSFYTLLNDYRDALIRQSCEWKPDDIGLNIRLQENVDKARIEVVQAFEKK